MVTDEQLDESTPLVKSSKKATPLPKLQLSVLLYLQLAEPITANVILPFIVQLVEETGITGRDISKVGYYTGLVESLFFLAEALMILQWGRLSDYYGRRPILLTGLFGLGLSMICFGLSQTFWSVVASRAVAGALNGNTGVIKCMMSEITDDTNLAKGLSFMPIVWSVGNTIGPLIGGSLQHPYERFGHIFQRSKFWESHPYFLPCATAALYSMSAFVSTFFLLKETSPFAIERDQHSFRESVSGTSVVFSESSASLLKQQKVEDLSLKALLTPRVLIVILNYALLALTDMAWVVLQPVFLATPISHGGLGMSPALIGYCLSGFGIANGAVSMLFFAPLHRRFGPRALLAGCEAAFIGCFALFPLMNAMARQNNGLTLGVWAVFTVELSLATLPSMAFSSVFIFLTSAAPTRSALGATTGLAQTTTSIMRAIGPAGATSLFALSVERNLLGGSFVYVVMCTTAMIGTVASALLPEKPWTRPDSK